MKLTDISRALCEARRFMDRAEELAARHKEDPPRHGETFRCDEAAALRRASVDLSKALSKMRRPPGYGR